MQQKKALDDKNTMWTFCPSIQGAYVMAVLFGITTLTHFTQAILYRKAYCWVITMAGIWQTVNYILRILSITYPTSYGFYAGWFILILVRYPPTPPAKMSSHKVSNIYMEIEMGGEEANSIDGTDFATLDQCLRIYGIRANGLEFH